MAGLGLAIHVFPQAPGPTSWMPEPSSDMTVFWLGCRIGRDDDLGTDLAYRVGTTAGGVGSGAWRNSKIFRRKPGATAEMGLTRSVGPASGPTIS